MRTLSPRFPCRSPSDDGVPALEYLVNGFCVFDNGDDTKAAAAKEFIKFVCDDETWGPKNVVRTGAFPVRASFGDLYAGNEEYKLLSGWTKYYAPYYNTMDGFCQHAHRVVEHAAGCHQWRRRHRCCKRLRGKFQRGYGINRQPDAAVPLTAGLRGGCAKANRTAYKGLVRFLHTAAAHNGTFFPHGLPFSRAGSTGKGESFFMAHRNPGKADGRSHALRRHDNIVGYLFHAAGTAVFLLLYHHSHAHRLCYEPV